MSSLRLRFDESQARAIALALSSLDSTATQAQALGLFLQRVADLARERAPDVSGRLGESVTWEITSESEDRVQGEAYSPLVYAAATEYGLWPGMAFPPPTEFGEWSELLGLRLEGDPTDFLMRRAVFEFGTEPQPFMAPAFEEATIEAVEIFSEALYGALSAGTAGSVAAIITGSESAAVQAGFSPSGHGAWPTVENKTSGPPSKLVRDWGNI